MAWTAPKTWATGDLVTAALLNTHLKDNLLALSTHTHSGAAGDGNDELSGVDSVVMDSISTPSAPSSSNQIILYDKTGRPYYRPNGGAETLILNSHGDSGDTVGTRGDVAFRGSSNWQRLGAGTSGAYLQTKGTGADPVWTAVSGSVVRKTANESVTSSTTLQDDDHLVFAIGASEVWAIQYHILCRSVVDIKFGLTAPSGAAGSFSGFGPDVGTSDVADTNLAISNNTNTDLSGSYVFGANTSGNYSYIQLNVLIVNSTNADDLQLQWAQNSSSGTATTVYIHSYAVAQKLA
jgi:hypothetical protein